MLGEITREWIDGTNIMLPVHHFTIMYVPQFSIPSSAFHCEICFEGDLSVLSTDLGSLLQAQMALTYICPGKFSLW